MRKRLVGAAVLLIGAGTASNSFAAPPLGIKGSDTLELVAKDVLAACAPAVAAGTTYVGGGSTGGEAAMSQLNYTQQISPMSRELSKSNAYSPSTICNLNVDPGCTVACVAADAGCTVGVAPTNGKKAACDPSKGAQELLIGLDGIAVVAANRVAGDSLEKTASGADDCGDGIVGGQFVLCSLGVDVACSVACVVGTDAGCTGAAPANGKYVFSDWRDVLAVVYAGQYHNTADAQTVVECTGTAYCGTGDPRYNPTAATHKVRNPARIDCNGTVRKTLLNSEWNNLFADGAGTPAAPLKCRNGSCPRGLKHAFRRGDLSGTTDTFVGLVGLIGIPNFTKVSATNFPYIDSAATANPFCNAGEAPMNKGDSDYLDLDPVRRISDSQGATPPAGFLAREGLEQVAQGFGNPSNPTGTRTDPVAGVLTDSAFSNFQNVGVDPAVSGGATTWWTNRQKISLGGDGAAKQPRRGLGVVLPIEIPTNFSDDQIAFWSPSPAPGQAPVKCRDNTFANRYAPKLMGANVVCPDNTALNLCTLPVDAAGTNFNCMTEQAVPAATGLRDNRIFNLQVVNAAGNFVKDNYLNPNLTLSAVRQNRVVTAFYRLHTTRVTTLDNSAPTKADSATGVCKRFDSTSQIGCLVDASACSIGFAGREAVDAANLTMAFQIGANGSSALSAALPSSQSKIENLVTLAGGAYPIARTLWVNAYAGLANVSNIGICSLNVDAGCVTACVAGTDPGCTGAAPRNGKYTSAEKDILDCFGASGSVTTVDNAIDAHGFIKVPAGTTRTRVCPAVFP